MLFVLEEIIIEILVKLPARELWRLRCVSKSWCKLIDSPFFVKMHLNHSIQNNSNQTIVFYDGWQLLYSYVDDLLDQYRSYKKFNHLFLESGPSAMVFGSCNGLLLVCKGDNTCRQKSYSNEICSRRCMKDFGIWNPNTGEYKSLPAPLPLPNNGLECQAYCGVDQWVLQSYGFGYDSGKDDYTVVMINEIFESDEKTNTQVDIYLMKLNSWRRIESAPLPLSIQFIQVCAVFVSGVLHWATTNEKDLSILAFDVWTEEFRFVAKPDNLPNVGPSKLHELKGNLCLSYIRGNSSEIWIMRDYGVKESWSKLLSIPLSSPYCQNAKLPVVDFPINRPLAYSGNKILLNESFGELVLRDQGVDTKKEDIKLGELGHLFVAYSCVDSLVRLSNLHYSSEEENDVKRKRRRINFI